MNIKEIEKQELEELLSRYHPIGFSIGPMNQSNGTNKISLISIEIMGFSGFSNKVVFDFSTLSGLVGLQGRNGCGKSSLWQAIEQCLCYEPKRFNKNKQTIQNSLTLKFKDKHGEHIVVCTPFEKTLDSQPVKSNQIIESVMLDTSLADLTARAGKDYTDYNAKVLNLNDLDDYFSRVLQNLIELKQKRDIKITEMERYDLLKRKYDEDLIIYKQRLTTVMEDSATFEMRVKEWETVVETIRKANSEQLEAYNKALNLYNLQVEIVKNNYTKYLEEQNTVITSKKIELTKLEGTENGSEKKLNDVVKKLKEEISSKLSEQLDFLKSAEELRAITLDTYLSSIFSEKEREIIVADYVNCKKRLETKLKKAKTLPIGECPTCTTYITAEMVSDLISKYEANVTEIEGDSKDQARLKSKEKREKEKFKWDRDIELSQIKYLVSIYNDALNLKDTEFRKKYSTNIGIEIIDNLLILYEQIFTIKSLRTKNAGSIKALVASIKQLESDLINENDFIKQNALQACPQIPISMNEPDKPKQITISSLEEPQKPKKPDGYEIISNILSELNLCEEISKKKSEVISRITKKYFDLLKPRIEMVARKLHLDLTVEISKNMSIGYTYNSVKIGLFSTGEQTIVNIAVALAYSYLESDILFIDEKLDTLDKDNFLEVQDILKSARNELGIRAFVIISHRELGGMDGRISI